MEQRRVDLNCDLGESFGAYTIGLDSQVMPHITSANIACGWHGGDPLVMERTVRLAKESGVAVGAHPGYPDLMGFGRRSMSLTPDEARTYVKYQVGALWAFARSAGVSIQHVKLHGALYNQAAADPALARSVCRGIQEVDSSLIVLTLAGSCMLKTAREMGLRTASEVFADRAYQADGSLVSRRLEGAVIQDEEAAVQRAVRMVTEGRVTAITGEDISICADSICVHGDNAKALALVRAIRAALEERQVEVTCLEELV
ncbi:MAG: LamB/YcsF family protein [Lawsonibacter sp.]|nr:LamB/YcsF family protein [Lawsonibacter sp.]